MNGVDGTNGPTLIRSVPSFSVPVGETWIVSRIEWSVASGGSASNS